MVVLGGKCCYFESSSSVGPKQLQIGVLEITKAQGTSLCAGSGCAAIVARDGLILQALTLNAGRAHSALDIKESAVSATTSQHFTVPIQRVQTQLLFQMVKSNQKQS